MTAVATIVISTHNRRSELRQAVQSALAQSVPTEVLVLDDGSTDGTAELVQTEFPQVRYERSDVSSGYIVQRNRGARLASAPILISIDDDAAFSSPYTVEQTLTEFDDPRVGVVAIPFVNVHQDTLVRQQALSHDDVFVTDSFVGTAYAVRRDLFLDLKGFRESLFHQGEERDFSLRMLEAGFVTRLGTADPIEHFESPRRDARRLDLFGRRNDILFAWHNVPACWLPIHLIATTINGLLHGMRERNAIRMAQGLLSGYMAAVRSWGERRPVRTSSYSLSRILRKRGPLTLGQITSQLKPLSFSSARSSLSGALACHPETDPASHS